MSNRTKNSRTKVATPPLDSIIERHWAESFKTESIDGPSDNSIAFDDDFWAELNRLDALITDEMADQIAANMAEHDREQKELMRRQMGLGE